MSHFTTIKTQFVAVDHLKTALAEVAAEFGLGPIRENALVGGWQGGTTRADLVLATRNRGYDIGFRRENTTYDLVADWFGIHGFSREALLARVGQRYTYHAVRQKLQKEGFEVVEDVNQADRSIHLVLRRVVN